MLFVESLTGIILIFCGLLVKKHPNLIAGYNSMTKAEREKINIKKLSTYLHNSFIIIGASLIIFTIVLYFISIKESYRLLITGSFLMVSLVFVLINMGKHQ